MIVDIVVLAALLVSAVIAFLRGFIREILTIIGVVGGGLAAMYAGPFLAPQVRGWIGAEEDGESRKLFDIIPYGAVADILAYGVIFIIVVLILSVISHLLSGWARAVGLGALDRTFGVVFGVIRGVVLLSLLYLPAYLFVDAETRAGWTEGSKTGFYVETVSGWIATLLPANLSEDVESKAGNVAESAAQATREKLQELDILRQDTKESAPENPGYKEEQRQQLNDLIKDGLDE